MPLYNSEREAVPGWPLTSLPITTVRASAYNWVTDFSMKPESCFRKVPQCSGTRSDYPERLQCQEAMRSWILAISFVEILRNSDSPPRSSPVLAFAVGFEKGAVGCVQVPGSSFLSGGGILGRALGEMDGEGLPWVFASVP